MIDQPVDGLVYGHQPKIDQFVPKVNNILEAADIPTGPPGVLPYSLEWYAGAKDRKAMREKLKDELLLRKDILRTDWVTIVCDEVSEAIEKVARVKAEPEPFDLALLLARTIHERPREKRQAKELLKYDRRVKAARDRARAGLDEVHENLEFNLEAIIAKERQDAEDEVERKAEVEAERKKAARLQKILDRNSKRLAGEVVSDTEGEDESDDAPEAQEEAAAEEEAAGSDVDSPLSPPAPRKGKATAASLDDVAGLPAPNGRQGSFRELPPLKAGGSFGWKGAVAEPNRTNTPPVPRQEPPAPPVPRGSTPKQLPPRVGTPQGR